MNTHNSTIFKIEVTKNKKKCGFVKEINYNTGDVTLTSDKDLAHKYNSEDEVQGDIDFLTKYYFDSDYIFTY